MQVVIDVVGEACRDHPNFSDMLPRNFSDMLPRNFPVGLRVFLFVEDQTDLLMLERLLQDFQYQVTKCNKEDQARDLLRNHRFDIAMIQVNDSADDRFRFILENGSEKDLSIIIISKDDSTESVIKWMSNGASDYLLKPIRPEDLRIIFKHVVKKIRRRSVEAEEKASSVGSSTIRNPNQRIGRTGLDEEVNEEVHHDQDRSSSKKRRVVWYGELHEKFLEAMTFLEPRDAVVPKEILKHMNVENISRENVASHLQKYRLGLKKENDKIKREQANLSLKTHQEGLIYVGADASNFYRGRNVQFPTHQINNIPQPLCVQQHTMMNPNNVTTQLTPPNNVTTQLPPPINVTPQLIRPPEHHYDGVSNAVFSTNQSMTHQHHHNNHQTSDFTFEENLGFNNSFEEGSVVANIWRTPEDVSLFSLLQDPPFQMRNDHEAGPSSMFHPSSISSCYTHSSCPPDQQESGRTPPQQ